MSSTPFTTTSNSTENKYTFIFNVNESQTKIDLEPYQSIVINSLHAHVKSLHRELEESSTLLNEIKEINQMNYEKVLKLKEEREKMREKMKKAKEEVEKLEKKLGDHQEVIRYLVEDRFKDDEPVVPTENILASYGPAWSLGMDHPVSQTVQGGLTVYGYQPPAPELQKYEMTYPATIGDGRKVMGYKQRPVNFYNQPTARI